MDGNRRKFFKKPLSTHFKRKGVSRKENWENSSRDQFSGGNSDDTVYRILCPSRKIGGVIGKGGTIVKALREETQAKITVADSVPGCDERVIIVYSPSEKPPRKRKDEEDGDSVVENEGQSFIQPHCAAQDALLKVHDRIVEDDSFGGVASDDDNENNVVSARLLVPNNMVGCLLGKRGDVIQRLRTETGANIRVLPADHLPTCAMDTDELVQISGKPVVAKRALYQVSTLLHQNPRKDKPPTVPIPYGGQGFHPPGGPMANMLPPGNPMWPHRNSASHSMPPMPWIEEYGNQPSGFGPGGFNGVPPGHGREPSAEFSMKILCSTGKIGGVIGKGGSNVKVIEQETGSSIHVEDASAASEERAIRVSAFEGLWNPRSQTIDAILQLQIKTSEFSEKGATITRLLVPSSKVGCILGQGGQVINEMRRRMQADIRVYSKDERPKCASEDEELVQISGDFGVTRDALAEIASRLRVRTLRDANAGTEPGPAGPVPGFGPPRSLPGRARPSSGMMAASSSGGYEPLRVGRHDFEPQSYPVPPAATGYPNMKSVLEANISRSGVNPSMRSGVRNFSSTDEVAVRRLKLQDPRSSGSEILQNRGSNEHLSAAQGFYQTFMASAGQNMNAHQGSYQNNSTSQQSSYQSMNAQQDSYQGMHAQQDTYQSMHAQQIAYQNMHGSMNAQQSPYQNMSTQQSPYSVTAQQGVYTNANVPQSAYNISAQQGTYQY